MINFFCLQSFYTFSNRALILAKILCNYNHIVTLDNRRPEYNIFIITVQTQTRRVSNVHNEPR